MSKISKLVYLFSSMIFFIIFDLYFSNLIIEDLRFKDFNNPILDLIFVQNTGAAFSILENSRVFLVGFSVFAIVSILIYVLKNMEKFSVFSIYWIAILVSGIGCNLYERVEFGYVRDFFKLNFIDFPIFNISDIFINISVIALIVIIIKNRQKNF